MSFRRRKTAAPLKPLHGCKPHQVLRTFPPSKDGGSIEAHGRPGNTGGARGFRRRKTAAPLKRLTAQFNKITRDLGGFRRRKTAAPLKPQVHVRRVLHHFLLFPPSKDGGSIEAEHWETDEGGVMYSFRRRKTAAPLKHRYRIPVYGRPRCFRRRKTAAPLKRKGILRPWPAPRPVSAVERRRLH